ncbi:MAG: hypothetical protein CVV44_21475 [Spirochaetae bacterium HGW-Spirochaetae-1]|jgi:biopolymer transport protein ExbD|nr:MAG: hypothetical protein CVV44_21475 [Spirochaetae bacterium HGW-Spirochaetae-1]
MAIKRKTKQLPLVPVSSMADIAFILLIFFILTSAVDMEKSIPVDLPLSEISTTTSGGYFHVWLSREGGLFINGAPISADDLISTAKYRAAANPRVKGMIGADREVGFSRINTVMEMLRDSGVFNIVLLTRKKENADN